MPKTTPARTRKSKQEIEKEYSRIAEEVKQQAAAASPKEAELTRAREIDVRQAVEGITVETVAQKISNLGIEVSKALADLSAKLTAEVDHLSSAREAVTLEKRERERLQRIDVAATALDQLVQEYASQQEQLEHEISEQRAAWSREEQERAQQQKEYDEALKKQRQREVEDYEYRKTLERKKAQDKYEEETRLLEKRNKEKQEALEKSWQQREAALKEAEQELARLRKEVDGIPERLRKEVEEAASQAAASAGQKYEQQFLLLKKDAEAERRLSELQIRSLNETVARQVAEVESLQRQLDEAKRQVQDIAVKAIEGASGASALAHINKIAMEQAKTRSPQS